MCLALAGRVVAVDRAAGAAVVVAAGRRHDVSLAPIVLDGGGVRLGDWVLVHTGLAVAVLDEDEARRIVEATAELAPPGGGDR